MLCITKLNISHNLVNCSPNIISPIMIKRHGACWDKHSYSERDKEFNSKHLIVLYCMSVHLSLIIRGYIFNLTIQSSFECHQELFIIMNSRDVLYWDFKKPWYLKLIHHNILDLPLLLLISFRFCWSAASLNSRLTLRFCRMDLIIFIIKGLTIIPRIMPKSMSLIVDIIIIVQKSSWKSNFLLRAPYVLSAFLVEAVLKMSEDDS